MPLKPFTDEIRGKEVHVRLLSNDLLENGRLSVIAVGRGSDVASLLATAAVEQREYTDYPPPTIVGQLVAKVSGDHAAPRGESGVVVVIEEKHGSVSADDARYIEWLCRRNGQAPRVIMLPEAGRAQRQAQAASVERPTEDKDAKRAGSFWSRQWRRIKAMPAPITKDAALAAIPRTAIPVGFSIFLAYLNRDKIPWERALGYTGVAFGFAVGFALLNQTVLNFITFWSEFTRDAFHPYITVLRQWVAGQEETERRAFGPVQRASVAVARWLTHLFSFISARGDVLIAGPLLGIGCTYIARLVLGPVGETDSVLTIHGFFLVLSNVIIGSLAGGPYPQVIAHLRAVGKISNRASMYLGIVDTVKMEIGRVADFGMQTLYNVIQVTLAVVFWALLLIVDRCFLKPDVRCLEREEDIELAGSLFRGLRSRGDIKTVLDGCARSLSK